MNTGIFRAALSVAITLAAVPAHADDAGLATTGEPQAAETARPSRGSVTLGGRAIGYTVTPGTLTLRDDDGNPIASMFDEFYINWLPSYAATAWYHGRLAMRPTALEPFLTEVRRWARGRYAEVLAKGYDATDDEQREVARQYAAFTGLSEQIVLGAGLRVDLGTFRKQLLCSIAG